MNKAELVLLAIEAAERAIRLAQEIRAQSALTDQQLLEAAAAKNEAARTAAERFIAQVQASQPEPI